jgi:hypothetical protein
MKLNDNYILREIAGEKVIVKQGTHGVEMTRIISFNESAAAMWEEFCNKEFTAEDAAEFLLNRYGIDADLARKDSQSWINKLVECGAIGL